MKKKCVVGIYINQMYVHILYYYIFIELLLLVYKTSMVSM